MNADAIYEATKLSTDQIRDDMPQFDTEILLATYNGAKFLPELLESLDRQTDQNWRVVARDDGSSDDTVTILRTWGREKGSRFLMLEGGPKGLGASGNFGALLDACTARYFLPCDQDDVWLDQKVERLRIAIREEEERSGQDTPLIVHTDLIVVDENLVSISESFCRYQRIQMLPEKYPWKLLARHNVVTGCAMIGNRALLSDALPVPREALMHDWWLALICSLQGRILFQNEPSVLYRQHGGNALGAQKWTTWRLLKLAMSTPFSLLKRPRQALKRTQAQAAVVMKRLGGRLSVDQAEFLQGYAQMHSAGLIARRLFTFQNRGS
ncbi:MAG: glycosyltransferase family 2 protein [Paracoccaceae bacterium]